METLNSFIRKYAELHSIPMTQARAEIERFENAFKEITVESGGINLVGFIKSEVKDKPAHESKNPRTKEKITVPAKKVIKVKANPSFAKMLEE